VALVNKPGVTVSHYCGTTKRTVPDRLAEHAAGTGAKITAAFVAAGGTLVITRIWSGSYAVEKAIKAYGKLHRLCPNCTSRAMKYKPKGLRKGKRIK
jgi:predicted GIY-YIG superfamily endonuclease